MTRSKRILSHPVFPLAVALLALAAWVALAAFQYAHLRPGAPLIYPLDDTYIHMVMAKNLALHGVLGINPNGFSAAASSILWPLLLALVYRVFGVSLLAPLWLNLLFAFLALGQAWRMLRRGMGDRPGLLASVLVGFVFFVPLPALVLLGMETCLHIFLALWFLDEALAFLAVPADRGMRPSTARLLAAAALLGSVRYENLAMIAFVSALLFLSRRFRLAALVMASALAPVIAFGLFSLSQGWGFLPNSLYMRSATGILADPLGSLPARVGKLWSESHLFVLMTGVMAGLLLDLQRPLPNAGGRSMALVFVLVLITHVLIDHFGYFYRYEAYVMALGILSMAALWGPRIGKLDLGSVEGEMRALLAGLVIFLALMPLFARGMEAQRVVPYGMANIYDQHYQIAQFLKENYAGSVIGTHDIGLIGFLSDVTIVDLAGLANREIGLVYNDPVKWTGAIDRELERNGARVVVAYPGWLGPYLPPAWKPVGSWTVDQRITVGKTEMAFYARDEAEIRALRARLADWAPKLEKSVKIQAWK